MTMALQNDMCLMLRATVLIFQLHQSMNQISTLTDTQWMSEIRCDLRDLRAQLTINQSINQSINQPESPAI